MPDLKKYWITVIPDLCKKLAESSMALELYESKILKSNKAVAV